MKLLVLSIALLSLALVVVSLEENPCNVLPNGTGFVNDPSGCDRYFSCIAFTPFSAHCPAPLYFDVERLVCDQPSNVRCAVCPPTGITTVPEEGSCEKWTLCVNGRELPQKCAPGTLFNRNIGSCDLSENVECSADTCREVKGGVGLAPSPVNCEGYFYCYNGMKKMEGRCQPGLAFDSESRRCVRAENVQCFPGAKLWN